MEDYIVQSAISEAWAEWTTPHSLKVLAQLEELEAQADKGQLVSGVPLGALASQRAIIGNFGGGGQLAPTPMTSKVEGRMVVELYCRAVAYIAGFVRLSTAMAGEVDVKGEWESTFNALVDSWKAARREARKGALSEN